jgi:flagellar P-ring protein precursor FlgI
MAVLGVIEMIRKTRGILIVLFVIFIITPVYLSSLNVRIKDISNFAGVRDNQLFGYGVVVGLEGTGDTTQNKFTFQTIANYLDKMGITMNPKDFQMRNTAAVAITAVLPPFPRIGSKIDVTVSSMGSAKSLQGGVLLISPLRGADGNVYAVSQGALSIGGFNSSQGGGGSVRKNHSTVARIPNGAIIEKTIPFNFSALKYFTLNMNNSDFTTTNRVVNVINKSFGEIAYASDSRTIKIMIPTRYSKNKVKMIALLENLKVSPDLKAKIILNERTGTIVFGENVKITKVAIAHGGITVTINPEFEISQPNPMSNGQTVITKKENIEVTEPEARFKIIENTTTIGDVVKTLNSLGATPRDIIAIIQAMKSAGALQADLEII